MMRRIIDGFFYGIGIAMAMYLTAPVMQAVLRIIVGIVQMSTRNIVGA